MATLHGFHDDDPAFMTCILRVNYQTPRWQKAVRGVLGSSKGVRSFKMDKHGTVEVSGIVDPNLLIKRLGKAGRGAQVCWFQFGQCSSNLYLPSNNHYNYRGTTGPGDNRYFPFRNGLYEGGQCCYPREYMHGYDRDEYCYLPPVTRSRGESIGCCSLM